MGWDDVSGGEIRLEKVCGSVLVDGCVWVCVVWWACVWVGRWVGGCGLVCGLVYMCVGGCRVCVDGYQ